MATSNQCMEETKPTDINLHKKSTSTLTRIAWPWKDDLAWGRGLISKRADAMKADYGPAGLQIP